MTHLSRNDPCWCGSGKKFKKCHIDRVQQEPLGRATLEEHAKRSAKVCCAQSLNDSLCTTRIVKAHTVSKSGCLKQISHNGHVMGTKTSFSELDRTQGKVLVRRIGINDASTFTGFCSYHDKELFSPLEDEPIMLSDEQLFLLAYRSTSRELYQKRENLRTAEMMKSMDRGMDIERQRAIQATARKFEAEVILGLTELEPLQAAMDSMLILKDFAAMNHCVIELGAAPKMLVSGSCQPEFDFEGRRLQEFNRSDKPMSHIIFNAISYENRGCFVFSWVAQHHLVCKKFIDSLVCLDLTQIGSALTKFCYTFCENTWASPIWWDGLEETYRAELLRRIQLGLTVQHQSYGLVPDKFQYDAYQVEVISSRFALNPNSTVA